MADTKYCRCGQPVVVDYEYNGLAYYTKFSDPDTGSEIDHCPGCGESVTAWLSLPGGGCCAAPIPGALLDEPPDADDDDDYNPYLLSGAELERTERRRIAGINW